MGTFEYITTKRLQHVAVQCLIASLALALLTVVCHRLHFNLATAGLLYVIVVVLLARMGSVVTSIFASIIAALCLAYLAPPALSFRIDDPLDGVAIAAFLTTSLLIAQLVSRLRRMAAEAVSSVDRRLIDAEERERARIARELHDHTNQQLALLGIGIEDLQNDIPNQAELRARIDQLREQTLEISADVQALSHELHSAKLDYLGLVAATQGFCTEFSEHQKLKIGFQSHDLPSPMPPDVSLCLFRVLQEALHNAAKHSGAKRFDVELWGTPDEIHLIVRDSGLGFDPKAAIKGRGLGLVSMQERIKLVKGEFSVDSQLNRGTTIHAKVPFSV
jgi:signal transduction histidine kinase